MDNNAPPEAVQHLLQNPALLPQFRVKYGYTPSSFTPSRAPAEAEQHLAQNPGLAGAFEQKYGYLPEAQPQSEDGPGLGTNIKVRLGFGSDKEQAAVNAEYDKTGTATNVGRLVERSAAKLGEGLTEFPSAAAYAVGAIPFSATNTPGVPEANIGSGAANAYPNPDDAFGDVGGQKTPEQWRGEQREWAINQTERPGKHGWYGPKEALAQAQADWDESRKAGYIPQKPQTPSEIAGSATRRFAAPVTESAPVLAVRGWMQGKQQEAVDALSPNVRRALELSLVEEDEENGGIKLGAGASNPWWWTANVIDVGVQAAPGMGVTALSARLSYSNRYMQALEEMATKGVPQSVAVRYAQREAMKAAKRGAVISGGFTEGAVAGGQNAAQTRDVIDSLDEETLMAYPGYMELRDKGMSHEQAREEVARDKAAAVAISSAAVVGITGAPMNAYFGALTARLGRTTAATSVRSRLATMGEAAAGEGAQEFVQEGAEQLIQNKTEQPITGKGTWEGVLENALTGAALGAAVGGPIGLATSGKKGKAAPKVDDTKPAAPPPAGPVESAQAAYDAAEAALKQGLDAARNPDVKIKHADIQTLRETRQKALVDYTRELLHAGAIKEADQAAVSEALKQAEAAGVASTPRKPAGGDVSPQRDAALEAAANAEMLDENDANDLISGGFAKVSGSGNLVLTPEGRRARKAAQGRAAAEADKTGSKETQPKQKDATVAASTPIKGGQKAGAVRPTRRGRRLTDARIEVERLAKPNVKPRLALPAEKRRAAKAAKVDLDKSVTPESIGGRARELESGEAAQVTAGGEGMANPQMREAFKAAADRARRARAGLPESKARVAFRLKGAPETADIPGKGTVKIEPVPAAKNAAAAYRKAKGITTPEQTEFARVDPVRATRIARAFDEMKHDPNDPVVKRAYGAMIRETMDQYHEIAKTGLKVEFIKPGQTDPYAASPRLAIEDVRNNNHLWVFPTDSGYGQDDSRAKDNPMLRDTGITIAGHKAVANDVFRIVHDYFGHVAEANGFRADGEENAWRIHAGMYSPLARRAMTSETRGQNSWVNYGPHGEKNRGAKHGETVYADQKIGLLPAEFSAFPGETMRFKHFSDATEDRVDLDPNRMGTGSKGAESKRAGPKVTSLYAEDGEVEPDVSRGRTRYNVEVPKEDIYDASEDPQGLLARAQVPVGLTQDADGNMVPVSQRFDMNKFEELVRDAGYLGYHTPGASGVLKGQARLFDTYPAYRDKPDVEPMAARMKRKTAPEDVLRHLTPEERGRLRQASAKRLIEIFDELPDGAEFAASAVAGQAKRGWYRRSAEALSNVFGPDAPRFAALLGALSPQTSVEWNFRNAVAVWVGWDQAGRPTDRKSIVKLMRDNMFPNTNRVGRANILPAWINNTVRALSTENPGDVTLSGPKVDSFAANLRGETERVTLDAWMANWAGVSQSLFKGELVNEGNPGTRPGYLAFSARVREAAEILSKRTGETWTASEVQETVWSWAKSLYENAESYGELATAREILDNKELTDELINATPDFAGLFEDPQVSSLLAGTVYGPRAAESAGEAKARGRPAGKAAPAAEDARRLRKAADRLDALRKSRKDAEDETRSGEAARIGAPARGIALSELQAVADRIQKELGVTLKIADKQTDLPDHIQAAIPDGSVVTGMFTEDEIEGTTELWQVRENIDSTEEAYANALHESVGHMGLRAVLGKSYHRVMEDVRKSFPDKVAWAARQNLIDLNHPDPAARRRLQSLAAEELIAYSAEKVLGKRGALSEQSVWRRIIAKVRDILRGIGLLNNYSGEEIEALIYRARDFFRKPAEVRAREIDHRARMAAAMKQQPDDAPQWLSPEEYLAADTPGENTQEGLEAKRDQLTAEKIQLAGHPDKRGRWTEVADELDATIEKIDAKTAALDGEQFVFAPDFAMQMEQVEGDENFVGFTEVRIIIAGEQAGYVTLNPENVTDSGWFPDYVYLKPRLRGKGLAQRAYAAISKRLGVPAIRSANQTPYGRKMWDSFKRRKVAFRMKNRPQTRTSAFKKWFGDSEVIYKDGEPKVVFHGTRAVTDFDAFYTGAMGLNSGYPELGAHFGIAEAANDRAGVAGWNDHDPPMRLIPVYLSIQNPLRLIDGGAWGWNQIANQLLDKGIDLTGVRFPAQTRADFMAQTEELRSAIESAGYDGIVYANEYEGRRGYDSYIAFHPEQIKSATGNNGEFSKADKRIAFAFKQGPTGNVDLDSFISKIGVRPQSLRQRWNNFKHDAADRITMGLFDELHGIRSAENIAGIPDAEQGYVSARLSRAAPEVVASIIEHGPPVWNDGAPDVGKGLGLLPILAPLKGNVNLWLTYVSALRAQRLTTEGRENLFTPAEIAAAVALGQQHPEFDVARAAYNKLQKQVLDFAQEAGVIDPQTRAMWEHSDYIPFHRIMSGGEVTIPSKAGGGIGFIRNQIKQLKGGRQNIGDPLENIVRNWQALMDASLQAVAGRMTIDNLNGSGLVTPHKGVTNIVPIQSLAALMKANPNLTAALTNAGINIATMPPQALAGLQKMIGIAPPAGEDVVTVWRGGKREFWHVHDPNLFRSLKNINPKLWGPWMRLFSVPKRIVTRTITMTPQFMVKNFWRDMWHSFVTGAQSDKTRINMLPTDSLAGLTSALANSPEYRSMVAGGGGFGESFIESGDPASMAGSVRRSINKSKSQGIVLNTPVKIWRFYRMLQNAAENANRVAVYRKARNAGLSRRTALYQSRDLMDFSMRGNAEIVRLIVGMTPFFNARLQGLYRLGRGASTAFASVALRGLLLSAATLALLAVNHDDERYKALTDQEKSNYWHFFVGDAHYRLPKPFEVGTVFGTIPEAIGDIFLTNADEPDAASQSAKLVAYSFGETLNLKPEPALVWPLVELAINQDTFTGSPILTQGDEAVLPEDQRGPQTAPTYAALAEMMPDAAPESMRSPKQLEHLARGYIGNIQDYVLLASDALVRAAKGEPAPPEKATSDIPGIRDFYRTGPARNTRYTSEMFKLAEEAAKVQASVKRAETAETTEGDARAEELEGKYPQLLDVADDFKDAAKKVVDLKKEQRLIQLDPDMTPEEKRADIDDIQQEIDDIAKDVYDLRPGGKLNPETAGELLTAPPTARAKILRQNNLPATADLLESFA